MGELGEPRDAGYSGFLVSYGFCLAVFGFNYLQSSLTMCRFLPLIPNLKKPAPYNAQAVETGKSASNHLLGLLEKTLESKTYLVGKSLTIADLFVAMYLARGMEWVLDADWRASHPNIIKYFNGITSIDQWKTVIPQMKMIEKETPNEDPYAQE